MAKRAFWIFLLASPGVWAQLDEARILPPDERPLAFESLEQALAIILGIGLQSHDATFFPRNQALVEASKAVGMAFFSPAFLDDAFSKKDHQRFLTRMTDYVIEFIKSHPRLSSQILKVLADEMEVVREEIRKDPHYSRQMIFHSIVYSTLASASLEGGARGGYKVFKWSKKRFFSRHQDRQEKTKVIMPEERPAVRSVRVLCIKALKSVWEGTKKTGKVVGRHLSIGLLASAPAYYFYFQDFEPWKSSDREVKRLLIFIRAEVLRRASVESGESTNAPPHVPANKKKLPDLEIEVDF